jgi:hypothetical protein
VVNFSKLFYKFVIVIVYYLQVCNCKMIQIKLTNRKKNYQLAHVAASAAVDN